MQRQFNLRTEQLAEQMLALTSAKDTQRDQINQLQEQYRNANAENFQTALKRLTADTQDAIETLQMNFVQTTTKVDALAEWCGVEIYRSSADGNSTRKGKGKHKGKK